METPLARGAPRGGDGTLDVPLPRPPSSLAGREWPDVSRWAIIAAED